MEINDQVKELIEKIDELQLDLNNETNKMNMIGLFVNQFAKLAFEVNKLGDPSLDIHEFNDKLRGLLSAVEVGDFDLFTDQMEYEMKPLLEHWRTLI